MERKEFNLNKIYLYYMLMGLLLLSYFESVFVGGNFAIIILTISSLIIGIIFTVFITRNYMTPHGVYLFILFFFSYFLYSSLIHFSLIEVYGVEHIKPDETTFYQVSKDAMQKLNDNFTYLDITRIQEYVDTPGAVYFLGRIAQYSTMVGENTVLSQKVVISAISALIPMILYAISRLYLSERISVYMALIYGFFSFVPYLSSMILRDIHVALMFIITIYILLQKFSFLNFLLLIIVSFFSYSLREQTGIFMMGFISVYLFVFIENLVQSKIRRFLVYMTIAASLLFIVLSSTFLMDMFNLISNSSAERSEASSSSGSLGAKISKLPFGLNVLALFGFSQIQPFPPLWIFSGANKGFFELTYLIAAVSWFFGWGFLVYAFVRKNIFDKVDLKLKLIFLFSIAYLILIAVVDFSQRRQMPVYPIIYLFMVFSYLKMDKSERIKVWITMLMCYMTLVFTINYLKL
ncbi:MAG: Unknown protein [uncultured Sulfurovum sp.]|uniref:Glycosyltransferase RgtA/B/C/D-like domain-containing protein n=1 Tax=uncultured Sulfurovum sp. TaxID=269237 RepID=A0A6S6TUS6_9BACT|nr:MAG: Unknown protein [uncultured Sulfurovum sp.]